MTGSIPMIPPPLRPASIPGLAVLLLVAGAAGQARAGDHELHRTWTAYNGGPEGIRYSALDQINRDNVQRLQPAWTYRTGDTAPAPGTPAGIFRPAGEPDRGGRYPVRARAEQQGVRPRRGHRQAALAAPLARLGDPDPPGPGLLAERGRPRAPDLLHRGAAAAGARRGHRQVDQHLRQGRGGHPLRRSRFALPGGRRLARHRVRGSADHGLDRGRAVPGAAREHPGLRRAHRGAALGVPHRAQAGRARPRHLGPRVLEAKRRRQRLGLVHPRREAGTAVRPHRIAQLQLLRRRPPRPEPVRQLRAGAGRPHRQAPLALPGRAPRSVGLRPDGRARAGHHQAPRQAGGRGRPGDQTRLRVRARSPDRQAAVPRARAPGAPLPTSPASRPGPPSPSPCCPRRWPASASASRI